MRQKQKRYSIFFWIRYNSIVGNHYFDSLLPSLNVLFSGMREACNHYRISVPCFKAGVERVVRAVYEIKTGPERALSKR